MIQTFDTDNVLFDVLKASLDLTSSINGGIYVGGERPDNSVKEDIVINTIDLTQDLPQRGTSNVNIHVADIDVKIQGTNQKKANNKRMKELTTKVLSALTAAKITGLNYWITNQNVIKEAESNQHFVNLRIEFSIH